MKILVGQASDTGRSRTRNEDAVLSVLLRESAQSPHSAFVLAVADGMGGSEGGQVASRTVLEVVERPLATMAMPADKESWLHTLNETFARAIDALRDAARQNPDLARMGTTLTCVAVHRGAITFAHIGDSRAYLLRQGDLRRLTTDHNAATELANDGRIAPQEVATHKARAVLTKWLAPDVAIPDPELGALSAHPGDILLVCSDGLHGMVADTEITEILQAARLDSRDLTDAANALVARANINGGRDNISVALGACF